jgi:hypothetical protein
MKTVLLAGAAVALALSAGTASAGAAHPGVSAKNTHPFHIILPKAGAGGYSQRDNDNGVGIVSQNFTDGGFTAYDAAGADDFKLKKKAAITEVDADGVYFNGAGPADSFDVHFYANSGGLPGKEVASCLAASYSDETGFGTPDIKCSAKFKAKKTAWVSVVANMAFGSGGEWGWSTNNTVRGNPAVWENPGGGFATGCNSWGVLTTCIAAGEGGDFSYAVLGKIK